MLMPTASSLAAKVRSERSMLMAASMQEIGGPDGAEVVETAALEVLRSRWRRQEHCGEAELGGGVRETVDADVPVAPTPFRRLEVEVPRLRPEGHLKCLRVRVFGRAVEGVIHGEPAGLAQPHALGALHIELR